MKNNKNLSWLMRLFSLTIILAFVAPVMINAQTGKTNFAGSWIMNATKSTQPQGGGGGQRMGGGDVVVTQEANLLTVSRTRTGQDGQATTTVTKYTLDGKETVNTTQRGESKSVATWSADGKTLTVVTTSSFNMNGETREMKSTAVWTMDGANLVITTTSPGQNGERVTKAVYDKK